MAQNETPMNFETKYHDLMQAIIRSRWQHGDCKSGKRYGGKPLACAACMAQLHIDEELKNYKGRTVRIC